MKKIYAYAYTVDDGIEQGGIYDLNDLNEIVSQGLDYCDYVTLKLNAKDYRSGKAALASLAIQLQDLIALSQGISYSESAFLQEFLEPLAKRYGLIREFRENCIL